MSIPNRLSDVVTTHSRVVIVALLLTTALVGAGMPMVDDDSSLAQFEGDSPEAEALEDIDDRFDAEGDENTTAVQLIARGDDVLTQESLLESLEFQQEIHANESINATLVENDSITGVENLVAITAITNEQIADLEERGAELEQRGEDLEQRGAELEQREAALEARSETLEDGLNETVALERQRQAQLANGETEAAAGTAAEINGTIAQTAQAADLDDEQTAEYESQATQAREIEADRWALEQQYDDPASDPEVADDYQELTEALEDVYAGATVGVLEDEYAQLEEDADRLEADQQALEEDSAQLEDDQRALEESGDERPSLEAQIEALEDLNEEEFEEVLVQTLSDDGDNGGAGLAFMPTSYEPGTTDADARMTLVSQQMAGDQMGMGGGGSSPSLDAQLDLRDLANQNEQEYLVFGFGIINDEIERSMGDSLAIVGPLALLFVVIALSVAYRDPLDIALGVVGILAVLVWTFGFMGWAGIAFNQMMIAVPVLLIGLSIDYAIHVFMRHREQRETQRVLDERAGSDATREQRELDGISGTVRGSMTIALAGVGVALIWVTATTAIGFLANLVSPIGPIREFGIVSSIGIIAALIIFGALIPALKVEIDSALEARGWSRQKRAFGTGGGRFASALTLGSTAARKAPLVILVVALLLTAGGVYGASEVDTSFNEEDFLAESPPAWTENLPAGMAPGEYQAKNDLDFVNENFQRDDTQAQILIEGDISDDDSLQQIADAQDEAAATDSVYTLANGEADVRGPLSVMEETAAQNESFNESFHAADTDGDDVPDQNVEALYDDLFEVNEAGASTVLYRTDDGEYESARLIIATRGDVGFDQTTDDMRAIAGQLDASGTGDQRNIDAGPGELNAIATGDPIVSYIVEQDLLETVLQSLLITLVAVFVFLTVAYRLTGNSATLGAVTLLPVAFSVSWILGTMYLIGMPFNVLTGMITSLTVGLGVAYSIHVSARYTLELERQGNVWSAMQTTVTGTGGALLGSAATTVGGFGTLAFAILPVLRQFGIITGLTITYAFLASVIVLPAMLVFWTRYFGPDVSFAMSGATTQAPTASDGGIEPDTADEPRGDDQ
ncbi:MMPL family transporter [Natronorubrum thiooxidans]|uniref:Predicted exporter protein, RND superfamily n=1 Tax=Natronorubrum thiooxidans TaxID=308853 RepID=A0A1N7FW94_9EURY|nr:MMPL family transporter [Natronorubrum thiooxidans]SIS04495.1 Predicted exporter protein, RND superfamily [Natronorubrum thiooxidans]